MAQCAHVTGGGERVPVHQDKSEAAMSSAVDLKTKEEKDAELDRRIEALRKKNEALVKRYQEIEEDKKRAEQEGIAVTTPRKPRLHDVDADRRKTEKENFSVTVDPCKPPGERIVNEWKAGGPRGRKTPDESEGPTGLSDGPSPPRRKSSGRAGRGGQRGGAARQERREWEPRTPRDGEARAQRDGEAEETGRGRRGGRRGTGGEGGGGGGTPSGVDRKSKEWEEKRRQNIEKMNEEMEKIAEYERGQRPDGDKPIRNFLDDPRRSGPAPDTDRKEGSRRHVRNWGGLDFDRVKTGAELEKEWTSRRPGQKGSVDVTVSMTGRERAEYLRWKEEREQIDEERLARHRNATGQWKREWDAQKTDGMFKEELFVASEGIASEQGSRRDDSKRPPKASTFGDFLSQGKSQGPRGDRGKGWGRGQKASYSMHDNRWEAEKDEDKEKEDKTRREDTKAKRKDSDAAKPPAVQKKNSDGDEDEDEDGWVDASDLEEDEMEEGSDSELDSKGDEKRDHGKEKPAKSRDDSASSPARRSRLAVTGSPKDQRTPRPKVHIPSPASLQESQEGAKPLSPFSPPDGHQPVSDWGEEMEMLSPRCSMGGESPMKPPSAEASPPQKEDQEQENTESPASVLNEPAEPQEEKETALEVSLPSEETVTDTDGVPTHPSIALPVDPAPSEVTEAAVEMDWDPAAGPSPEDESAVPPALLETDQSSSEPAGGTDEAAVPAGIDAPPAETEHESSG
ncbi:coiled-coil domain-containing protein 9 [Brachionichthys hirsutus]|uniref:coiled-coil domain-containing protein 9 n=1 Tax=Brachionichthys hirsutus TaxID=412623 RepID=UPI0036044927